MARTDQEAAAIEEERARHRPTTRTTPVEDDQYPQLPEPNAPQADAPEAGADFYDPYGHLGSRAAGAPEEEDA